MSRTWVSLNSNSIFIAALNQEIVHLKCMFFWQKCFPPISAMKYIAEFVGQAKHFLSVSHIWKKLCNSPLYVKTELALWHLLFLSTVQEVPHCSWLCICKYQLCVESGHLAVLWIAELLNRIVDGAIYLYSVVHLGYCRLKTPDFGSTGKSLLCLGFEQDKCKQDEVSLLPNIRSHRIVCV